MDKSGVPYFNWTAGGMETDDAIISGFLSAINMFAMSKQGQAIKKISLDPTTFFFEREQNLVFVVITNDESAEPLIRRILLDIKSTFIGQFGKYVVDFNGNLNVFDPFKGLLQAILARRGYLDFQRGVAIFEGNSTIFSYIMFDIPKKKILYQRQRDQTSREGLALQANILAQSAIWILAEEYRIQPQFISLHTYEGRVFIIYKMIDNLFIFEHNPCTMVNIPKFDITDLKVHTAITRPEKFAADLKHPFIVLDTSKQVILTNDSTDQLKGSKIAADLYSIINASKKICGQFFKENLIGAVIHTNTGAFVTSLVWDSVLFMHNQSRKICFPSILEDKEGCTLASLIKNQTDFEMVFDELVTFKKIMRDILNF
jgi:hypothetical protein